MKPIDPVTLVVVQNGLQQVASEMDLTFERAAFSPVISEGFDRSDGIYSKDNGEVIAQGELGLPIFVGVMQFTTRAVIEHVAARGADSLKPGDIFIINDPYAGGTHLMDVKMVKPFFYRGRLWAYLSNTGHWPDTGGSVPGGFSSRATEVQQEGLRLPPVKLFREGVMDEDILSIILANIRVPEERIGDIKAQVAALTVGERRLTALIDRYGDEMVTACVQELRDRSEQMMRAHIAKIPDGLYRGEAFLDSDGIGPSRSGCGSRRRAPTSTSTSRSRARRAAARSTASSRPRRRRCTWRSSTSSPTCRSTRAASSRCTSPIRTTRSSTRAIRARCPAAPLK
jgi:N-methylhydantoinase B